MAREYNVFLLTGEHLSGPHRKREVAERNAAKFRAQCPCEEGDGCADNDMFPHGVRVYLSVDGYYVGEDF